MSEFIVGSVLPEQRKVRSVGSITPLVTSDHVYEIPGKLIKTPADMKIWEKSEAYFEYLGFILAINEAIKGKSNSRGSEHLSEHVIKVGEMLDKLDARIDETPPIQQPQRFGNAAFRTWYQKLRDESLTLLQQVLPENMFKSVPEIVTYLVDSFGNSTRIDYGTGHELSFVMFLCCLFKIGLFRETDKVATGCYIFPKYLEMARKLQKTYRMEPAGSHGVWSLDDYQFVPFIWGSSQLFAHPTIEPSMFLNQQVLNEFGEDYMFLTCIQFINSVKTGPFAEHSNQLWSISGVSSWTKINGGLIKMYKAEILSKFPVVQHIVFGSLFTLKAMEQCMGLMTPKTSMVPPPVPSTPSLASSTSSGKSGGSTLRTIPSEERGVPDGSEHEPSHGPSLSQKSENSGSSQSSVRSDRPSERSARGDRPSQRPTRRDTDFEADSSDVMERRRPIGAGVDSSESLGAESVRFAAQEDEEQRGPRTRAGFNVGQRGPTPM